MPDDLLEVLQQGLVINDPLLKMIVLFTRKLIPDARYSTLDTIQLDAASLYQILGSKDNREHALVNGEHIPLPELRVSDFDFNEIDSINYAISHKDAVFASIYDLESVFQICNHNRMDFAQMIPIHPGFTTAVITGFSHKKTVTLTTNTKQPYMEK